MSSSLTSSSRELVPILGETGWVFFMEMKLIMFLEILSTLAGDVDHSSTNVSMFSAQILFSESTLRMKQSCPEESSSTMLTLPDTGRVLTFSVDIDHLPLELQSTTNLKTGLSTTGMNLSTTSGMGILKVN